MKIIQLVRGYSKGDGVGNVITALDQMFERLGYQAEILNRELTAEDVDDKIFSDDVLLFYHVALSVDPLVSFLKCRKILVFHNITDPDLLLGKGLMELRMQCSAGLYDIGLILGYFDGAIAFSEYSKRVLVDRGWNGIKIFTIPLPVRFDKLSEKPDRMVTEKYCDGCTNILFAGRVMPHKKFEDVISAFAAYKKKYNKTSRLFLVGGIGNNYYYKALKDYVKELEIEEDVYFPGHVSFAEYCAYYHVADVFLCMSAHEGFCIPLAEAMYFDKPIIAAANAAIPDTLDGSGVLVTDESFEDIADIINRLVSDAEYKKTILDTERERLEQLQPDKLEPQYEKVIKDCILMTEHHDAASSRSLPFISLEGIDISDDRIKTNPVVVYGYGAAGGRLVKYLLDEGVDITCVCDRTADESGGGSSDGVPVVQPESAIRMNPDCIYIISVQSKKIVRDITVWLIENGVSGNNIFVFDEIKGEVC